MKLVWALLLAGALTAWAEAPVPVRDPQSSAVRELVDLAKLDAAFRFDLRYDRDGAELPMPTPYDDFSERAHREAKGVPTDATRNSKPLESTMLKHGFLPSPFEWWHFAFRDWKTRPPLDVPLDQLP